jgi:hypothetical protein
MRALLASAVLFAALCAAAPAVAVGPAVSAFYYPWFGTAIQDGGFSHWARADVPPPHDIASGYYPAFGLYSSSSTRVVNVQMADIERAGIDEIVVSWWGKGSAEDLRLPTVVTAARARGISVAAHLEPYHARSVQSTVADIGYLHETLGIRTFYVYQPFDAAPADWAVANDALRAQGLVTFAQTGLVGAASAGHFSGLYTYDILTYGGGKLARLCAQARARRLLCAPSVGPGYDANRATGDQRVKPRRNGATYDSMWHAALSAGADLVTITSYNEWQESTQIEPASSAGRRGSSLYGSYDGAWGLSGAAAQMAYIDRTAYWSRLFKAQLVKLGGRAR